MAIPMSKIVARLRSKADLVEEARDVLQQDGTNYTLRLTSRPIVSGSDEVFITHTTYTTGYNQQVPRNGTQSAAYSSGVNLVYDINYNRGEVYMYRGSGMSYMTGTLAPFAPWNTSQVIVYYQKSKYTDNVLSDYVSYAVADVESALQIGMYVSGISGDIAPLRRSYLDEVHYFGSNPYAPDEKFVITEDVEIIQELIAQKAAYNLAQRERRVGAGNAIRIKDGDTEIDTAVNQRYLVDYVRDLKADYDNNLKWIMYNMLNGYSLRQIDEQTIPGQQSSYTIRGGLAQPTDW